MKKNKVLFGIVFSLMMFGCLMMNTKATDVAEESTYYQGHEIDLIEYTEGYLYNLDGKDFSPEVPKKKRLWNLYYFLL